VHLGQNKYGRRWRQYDTRFQQHAYSCARQIILFPNIYLKMKYIGYPYKVMLKTYHHVDLWNHHMNGMHVYPHSEKWSTNIFISQWLISIRPLDKEIEKKIEKISKMLIALQK
jgi:hypothetical protein